MVVNIRSRRQRVSWKYALVGAVIAMPLTFALAGSVGEMGIWLAAPVAEVLLVGLTGLVLAQVARAQSLRWGLFTTTMEARA